MSSPKSIIVETEEQVEALRELRRQDRLSHDSYCRMIVGLSLNYIRAGMEAEAVALLRTLPLSYFSEQQLSDMMADSDYCAIAIEVAEAIHAFLGSEPQINMRGGDA